MGYPAKILAPAPLTIEQEARRILANRAKLKWSGDHVYSGDFTLGEWADAAQAALDCGDYSELEDMIAGGVQ